MPTEIIRFSVDPTRLNVAVTALGEFGSPYFASGGAESARFLQDVDDRSRLFAVIEWASREDAAAAGAGEDGRRFFEALRPFIVDAPQISYGDVIWQLTR